MTARDTASTNSPTDRAPLLSLQEVARLLRLSERTVRQHARSGALRSVVIGRRRLVDPVDLDQFIESRKTRRGRA